MQRRHDDSDRAPLVDAEGNQMTPPLKITREIPLWGIVSVLLGLFGQGVATYYGQQRSAEKIADLTAAVSSLSTTVQRAEIENQRYRFGQEELARRVLELERLARIK